MSSGRSTSPPTKRSSDSRACGRSMSARDWSSSATSRRRGVRRPPPRRDAAEADQSRADILLPHARESELRFVGGEVERPLDIKPPRGDDASPADVEEPCGGRRRAWRDGQAAEGGGLGGGGGGIRNEQRAGPGRGAVRKR